MAHNYLLNFRDLASEHRMVIHYDQIGCGLSTHLPDAPVEFWSISLFLDELDNLLKHLNISSCYDLLGHSWGGMLACEHAVRQPSGLRCLILGSSPSDIPSGLVEVKRLCGQLPPAIQETFLKHEAAGTTESDEYQAGIRVFYNHFVCRVSVPPEFEASVRQCTQDPTVYQSMWGASEFYVTGILKDWSIVERLHLLKVPTLIYSGLYDEITPRTQLAFLQGIHSNVRQVLFTESSHTPHIEERTKTMATITQFLDHH